MTYPRPLRILFVALIAAAGCGGAARSSGNNRPPVDDVEPDAAPPDETPPPKLDAATPTTAANGEKCTSRSQCDSGNCIDGVCCDTTCTGSCKACNIAGSVGTCTEVPDGEDPNNECSETAATSCGRDGFCDGAGACRKYKSGTECAPATCTGSLQYSNRVCDGNGACQVATSQACAPGCVAGLCPAPCSDANPCASGLFCDPATVTCKPKKAMGLTCVAANDCASNFCVDGVCCGSACTDTCQACNVIGAVGNCTPVPVNTDPKDQCPTESASPCGRTGYCDGAGACSFTTLGTSCGGNNGVSCTGTTETQRSCDGRGMCISTNPRSCVPYRCMSNMCGVTCFTASDCAPGNSCNGGACEGGGTVNGGEILHWQFDETSNTTTIATDSSGNNHDGSYVGNGGNRPGASNNVPTIGVPNPRSRDFTRANREAVQLAAFPNDMRPLNDFSIATWYRATGVDTNGADLISGGDSYYLRLRTGSIEFGKRITNNGNTSTPVQCRVTVNGHLNGQWHHIAGVTTSAGMVLYFDGNEVCSNTQGGDVFYDRGQDFFVGRHGFNENTWDFEGNIDDVRVFGRELTADDVRALAGSTPGAADMVLHWKLDSTSTTDTNINDSSSNNLDGTLIGNNGNLAAPSTDTAPIGVVNPRSRDFNRTNREAIQRTNMTTVLKPQNDLTVSAWYKTNSIDTSGAELVSAGDNYSLRLRTGLVEFSKRINDGTAHWVQCQGPVSNTLNNTWHHVAAVTSPDGMRVYFDGNEVCTNSEGGDIVYDQGNTFFVGRHGNGQQNWDFQGLMDDVRVYGRALDANEIADLFGGTRPAELLMQWKFDEASTTNTQALDSSGSNLNGTYLGTGGLPQPNASVPPNLTGNDPLSRRFLRANRQAVRLQGMPTVLKLVNDFSISAWYRSNGLGGLQGEEIVSGGNSYILRVRADQIEFTKRTAAGYAQCIGTFAGTTDNNWHHVVGTTSAATGMVLYVDGAQVMTLANRTDAVVYDANPDLTVGRHPVQTTFDFDGYIDDVRVYSRALTDVDVTAIYQGQQ
jgi:hypothetical protein